MKPESTGSELWAQGGVTGGTAGRMAQEGRPGRGDHGNMLGKQEQRICRLRLEMARHALKRDMRCPGRTVVKGKERFGLRRKRVELKFEYQREKKQFTRHLILCSLVTVHVSHLHIYPSPFLSMALHF